MENGVKIYQEQNDASKRSPAHEHKLQSGTHPLHIWKQDGQIEQHQCVDQDSAHQILNSRAAPDRLIVSMVAFDFCLFPVTFALCYLS